jgi:hypothetical protein
MKKLIVTADDVGLDRGMTEGAIRAHREGIVTACSIVANGAVFDDAVARLRDVPSLEVGVHLALVEERSLTGLRMPRKYTTFVPLYLARVIAISAIEGELRADRAGARDGTARDAPEWTSTSTRCRASSRSSRASRASTRSRTFASSTTAAHGALLSMSVLSNLGRRARNAGLTNDHTIGVAIAGHLEDVTPLLDHVDGVTELVTHPGVGVSGYPAWNYAWERETRALCAPGLREEIARRGIELTTPASADRHRLGG